MTQTLAAVLRSGDQPYRIEEVSLADPRPEEVLVRIVATGMCHTDLLGRAQEPGFLPAVLGHEGAGVVERVGSAVTTVRPGDHVVLTFDSCGICESCRRAAPAYCAEFRQRNLSGQRVDGSGVARDKSGARLTSRWFAQSSFSQYAIATERNAVVIDRDVPLDLVGPLGCGVQTGAGIVLNEFGLEAGQTILVFGAGAVGLSAVLAAKLAGARHIAVIDRSPQRRRLALELGATVAEADLPADTASRLLGGAGTFDFSVDTTGVAALMEAAVGLTGPGGTIALVAGGADRLALRPVQLSGRRLTYVIEGSSQPHSFIPSMIDWWRQGRFPFDRMIRHYRLEDINEAEADALSGEAAKPVLVMQG
ncbi:NAD(P)-dependent alcohol dehydrogenase [Streptomyces sp. NPDC026672]|uniref:NAD(P)-dependent alcohol dehydrogenase n=1 Tax=unclassified Streptomyces TaxID=2593676 RepID=UPI0033F61F4C